MQENITPFEEGQSKLPSGLNALTILTYIGCAVLFLMSLATPALNKLMLGFMDKAVASGRDFSDKEIQDMRKGREAIELVQANLVPVMVIGMLGIVLCFFGALWMRKLKKDGFWIYTAGELLPLVGGFIIMGTAQFNGVISVILAVGIPILFVILYATQRKYLVK